jgi:predicted CoA-binding protein
MDITTDDAALCALLGTPRRIAVLGASPDAGRPSNNIYRFLRDAGHDVIPVNPMAPDIEGVVPAKTLRDAAQEWGAPPEIVDVFRRPAHLPAIVDEASSVGAAFLWLQLGVVDAASEVAAREAGMTTITDRCILVEATRLGLTSVRP